MSKWIEYERGTKVLNTVTGCIVMKFIGKDQYTGTISLVFVPNERLDPDGGKFEVIKNVKQ